MAHFAKLDQSNTVVEVLVVHNNELLDENGTEQESKGINFLKTLFGSEFEWKQTSYNANIRKNYAGIGYSYDEQRDAFIPPQPFASWVLDENTCQWKAPVSKPDDQKFYQWDEPSLSWIELQLS